MNPKQYVAIVGLGLVCWLGPTTARAQQAAPAAGAEERARLREDLERLEAQLAAIKERLRALETASATPAPATPVAAAPVATAAAAAATAAQPTAADEGEQSHTGPISGYMDFHFNKQEQDHGRLDFHRFVLLFNHSFTDRLRFVGELELEHALVEGLEEAGELELEQAYLDFLINPKFNLRAGMLLMPVGLINERHEPPSFYGVERPFVDTVIVPSTWFEVGAGAHGDLGRGFSYKAFLAAPLDASQFNAEEGIREGRQKGVDADVRDIAVTGRLEYRQRGLVLGSSFWRGKTGFATPRLHSRVGLVEFDGRYNHKRLDLRGEFAHVFIDGAGELNDAIARTVGVSPNIASQLRGFYLESGYHLFPTDWPHDFAVFARYENFDTQYRMPAGHLPLKEFDRSAWVTGFNYWPDPDIAVKFDYVVQRNRSDIIRAPNQFNLGLGWWF